MSRNISITGLQLIKKFEGCRLTAYKPVQAERYWTIGWGHYGADVDPNGRITQEQADQLLYNDVQAFVAGVNKYLKVDVNQNQFDALVSFAYNCGIGALQKSTLLAKLNAGDVQGAANEFPKFCHGADGSILKGLQTRRAKEYEVFLTKDIKEDDMGKYSPTIIKQRIVAVNGKLQYIPLTTGKPYATKATDIRLLKLDKNHVSLVFKAVKGAKVSNLVKQFGADYGINFPYFDGASQLPIGTVWDGKTIINGAFGKVLKWHSFVGKGNTFEIKVVSDVKQYDFGFPCSPTLISNGKLVWDYYNTFDETAQDIGKDRFGHLVRAQRTAIGIDKDGNLLIAVSDGRTKSDQGCTIEEMALYLLDKGAVTALNGDGGSSTILADKKGGVNQAQNIGVNERPVHHALLIYLK